MLVFAVSIAASTLTSFNPSTTCVPISPTSVTASPKLVTISAPAITASTAVSFRLSLVSSIDLNSYTAVEFDFMYDICKAIEGFDSDVKIVIKVRPNGYKNQYVEFQKTKIPAKPRNGKISIRVLLDRASLEIFSK